MLQKIREASSGWLAGVILGPLIVMFGLWGISGYFQGQVDTYAARITITPGWFGTPFGAKYKDITVDQFRSELEQERQFQRKQQGPKFDQAAFDTIENKRQVIERMIRSDLLNAAAIRDGLSVSGQQLYDAIAAEPAFQAEGKFDPKSYAEILSRMNPPQTPEEYQANVRTELLEESFQKEIELSGIASAKEVDDAIGLSGQKRDLRYVELPVPADGPVPGDAELQAWYKAHAADYRTPEQVSLEYLELDASTMAVPTTIDDATLRQRYDSQKSRYIDAEQRLASHILINVPANASPAVEKAAQAKAAALAAQARAPGADFAALARANSQDEGSKNLGGDLGWLTQGVLEQKAFANALFALKPGQISDPVRTSEGWHVIELRQIKQGNQIPFETVRAQIERDELKDQREKLFSDLSGKLIDLTLKDSTTLTTAAHELGMTVQKTPLFTRTGGTGIAANPNVIKAAFSASVLENGDNSDEIDLDSKDHEHMVVIRVAEHLPVKTLTFAQVHDRVVADVLADRRTKASKAAADALLARATKGETLDAIAASIGATAQTSTAMTRDLTAPSIELVEAGFRLPRPVQGKPLQIAIAVLGPGHYALVEATKVVEGDTSTTDPATRSRLRTQIAEKFRGALDARVYTDALKREFAVKVAEDRL